MAALLLNGVCYVVVVTALARAIGKDGIGQFYTIVAVTTAVCLICEAGIGTVLTHRIATDIAKSRTHADQAFSFYEVIVAISAALLLLYGVISAWATGDVNRLVGAIPAAIACGAMQVQRFCIGVFRGFDLFRQENVSRVLQGVVLLILVVTLTSLHWATVVTALFAFALSHIAAAAFLLLALCRTSGLGKARLSGILIRDWLWQAVPLGLGDVLREVSWQLDTILLGLLQPAAVVGLYSLAYRPLGPLKWLPQAVLAAAFPTFSRLALGDPNELRKSLADCVRLVWVASIPIAVLIFVFAKSVVLILGGPQFAEAALPLRILICITTVSYLSIPFRFLFAAVGKQLVFTRVMILLFSIELVAEAALIPVWSYFGACAGILLGELTFLICSVWICRVLKIVRMPWEAIFLAPLAGVAMGWLLWSLQDGSMLKLLIGIPVAATVYIAMCLLFRALRIHDIVHFCGMIGELAGVRKQ